MAKTSNNEYILIIDFGSQVTQLIARRVRESGVFSQVVPCTEAGQALCMEPVSYTHLTLPTNREV